MIRAMLDLETMGDTPSAAVVQIGAVLFDLTGPIDGTEFLVNVSFASAIQHGQVTGETIGWWLQQSDAARAALLTPAPVDLRQALADFYRWWSEDRGLGRIAEVWSHATFDAVILTSAYRSLDRRPPFGFRQVRDLRTLFALAPAAKRERQGVHHQALDDAIWQAHQAAAALSQLVDRRAVG